MSAELRFSDDELAQLHLLLSQDLTRHPTTSNQIPIWAHSRG